MTTASATRRHRRRRRSRRSIQRRRRRARGRASRRTEPASMPANGSAAVTPAGGAAEEELLVEVILAEGVVGRYEALSLDGGFRGRFGPADPYYQRAHDGLRLGPHQATQDTGELGELLALMRDADPAGFAQIFGPEAPALLEITTAEGPSSLEMPDGRGPRVQPVAGLDLWEEPWVERFRAAARHLPFQAAMRAQILARRLDPMRPAIEAPGLGSRARHGARPRRGHPARTRGGNRAGPPGGQSVRHPGPARRRARCARRLRPGHLPGRLRPAAGRHRRRRDPLRAALPPCASSGRTARCRCPMPRRSWTRSSPPPGRARWATRC